MTLDEALQLAITRYRAGQASESEAICRQILTHEPQHAAALRLLGVIALTTRHFTEAVELISKAVAIAPTQADYHSDLGAALRMLGRLDEAIVCFRRAVELQPEFVDAHLNLGEALAMLKRFDEAIVSCRRGLALRPDFAAAHSNLGNALTQTGQLEEAVACYRRAIALRPDYAEAHNRLGNVLAQLEQAEEAAACFRRALDLLPDYAEAHGNLGLALAHKGWFEQAVASYRMAIACDADFATAHWNLALLLLLLGKFEEGWREHEWRWDCPAIFSPRREFTAPQWDGSPAPGATILLHAEQGFGDTIQFMRYVPLVRERAQAARVIVECQPALVRLLDDSGGWDAEVVAEGTAPPPFDFHLPMLSLPLALRIFEPLPMSQPYLRAERREQLRPGFRVGVAWAGSATHKDDRRRSIPFEKLSPLLRVPGVGFYSLQIPSPETSLIDLTAHIRDFADTAALIAELDLVITVDTAVAHLAGALGRFVWTLLPFVPDWRWGLNGEDTPWYPTMRLFRQRAAGDWDEVIARVAAELTAVLSKPQLPP